MYIKSYFSICFTLILAVFLSSCSTVTYYGSVSSMSVPIKPQNNKYFIIPNKTINPNGLEFQKFSHYLEIIFSEVGLKRVYHSKESDINIFLAYGVSPPKTQLRSYAVPVFGQTGVSSSNTSGTINRFGNYSTYSATTNYEPQYGITGYMPKVQTIITYDRYLAITAVDRRVKNKELWKAIVHSEGQSNDLLLIFPILVTALKPYVWKNTGHAIAFKLTDSDRNVLKIKDL